MAQGLLPSVAVMQVMQVLQVVQVSSKAAQGGRTASGTRCAVRGKAQGTKKQHLSCLFF